MKLDTMSTLFKRATSSISSPCTGGDRGAHSVGAAYVPVDAGLVRAVLLRIDPPAQFFDIGAAGARS